MESLLINSGVSVKDFETLCAIVNENTSRSPEYIFSIAKRVIKNINVNHGFLVGYLIGYMDATEKTLSEIHKNNSLCQRQN